MYLETIRDGTNVVLMAKGRIDSNNASEFQEAVSSAIAKSDRTVVIDCQDLTFISSAGLRVVLLVFKEMRMRGARVARCSLSSDVQQIFIISGFHKIIPIHSSQAEALQPVDEGKAPGG